MGKGRLEAFSDGVIAIIITIMVLEMKVPHGEDLSAVWSLYPVFISYALSFFHVGIYWNNHHHMLHAVNRVTGGALWANLHLLFWLSLVPFTTGFMGENHFAPFTVAFYGANMLMCAFAYFILARVLIRGNGKDSGLGQAVGNYRKEWLSLIVYTSAVLIAYFHPYIAIALYYAVGMFWLIPDKRIEKALHR